MSHAEELIRRMRKRAREIHSQDLRSVSTFGAIQSRSILRAGLATITEADQQKAETILTEMDGVIRGHRIDNS